MAGWQWWVAGHVSSARDLVTLYYTNYLGFQIYNVPLRDLPLVAWHNLETSYGHDSFLLEEAVQAPIVSSFLERLYGR